MNYKNKFIKDFLVILLSNGIILISNIFTGLIIPKLLGVNNYGYYKIFTLYLGYAPLFHIGFVDGVLLKHGGENYNILNREKFRFNTRFFFIMQTSISLIIVIMSLLVLGGIYKFIAIMVGIDTSITNISSYYQYISQCTMRFRELSLRRFLQSFLKILLVVVCYVLYKKKILLELSSYYYIIALVLIDLLLLVWYVFTYREITFGNAEHYNNAKERIIEYFKSGIIVTIAFQLSNLVFSLDRQFVSLLFDTNVYGTYSFAYSLVSMATVIISAISLVLFPTLKRKSEESIVRDFADSIALISGLVFLALIGYYPLSSFIRWYLPNYEDSLLYLRIVFPGLAISSCITTIIFTYYKVLNRYMKYFRICLFILVISVLLNGLAYYIFKTPAAISWASIITLGIWFLMGQAYFIRKYKVKWISNFIYMILMSFAFYFSSKETSFFSLLKYFVAYVISTLLIHFKTIRRIARMIEK